MRLTVFGDTQTKLSIYDEAVSQAVKLGKFGWQTGHISGDVENKSITSFELGSGKKRMRCSQLYFFVGEWSCVPMAETLKRKNDFA